MGVLTQYEADQMADGPAARRPIATNHTLVPKPAKPRKSDGSPQTKDPVQVVANMPDMPAPLPASTAKPASVAADSMKQAKGKIIARAMSPKSK